MYTHSWCRMRCGPDTVVSRSCLATPVEDMSHLKARVQSLSCFSRESWLRVRELEEEVSRICLFCVGMPMFEPCYDETEGLLPRLSPHGELYNRYFRIRV